jgi:hypothetical protein
VLQAGGADAAWNQPAATFVLLESLGLSRYLNCFAEDGRVTRIMC